MIRVKSPPCDQVYYLYNASLDSHGRLTAVYTQSLPLLLSFCPANYSNSQNQLAHADFRLQNSIFRICLCKKRTESPLLTQVVHLVIPPIGRVLNYLEYRFEDPYALPILK